MKNILRVKEYGVFLYRLFLVFLFYTICRVLFLIFNIEAMSEIDNNLILKILAKGLIFDTAAIVYVNLLFILLSIFPFFINFEEKYQKILFYIYFIFNIIAISGNFIDMVYYPFSKTRLTTASFAVIENETNQLNLLIQFLKDFWYLLVIFFIMIFFWIFLYRKMKPNFISFERTKKNIFLYLSSSVVVLLGVVILSIAGIRGGDLSTSTRPINMLDANRYVNISAHADAILNTPFCLIRTIGKDKGFRLYHLVNEEVIQEKLQPIKQYSSAEENKKNVVIFILESFSREYWGCMNKNTQIPDFKSYTPFLDSLATHSVVFDNAYANGLQSIHGMSSILAGIPTFSVAYTSSPFVKQETESIVYICKSMNYDTSFFHSAPNGSMGFLGFSNILGFDNYYGKAQYDLKYPNHSDFDGVWGIWDEPFFKLMNDELRLKKEPFLSTIFTTSSHHPFKIPEKYQGKFDKGTLEIHPTIQYTDNALKEFFSVAKKEKWFKNTIFVFTADHTNMSAYEFYQNPIQSRAVPIMFYSPEEGFLNHKISSEVCQQIDIYPSVAHLLGYNKPFRSWGRSLFSEKQEPKAFVSDTKFYNMIYKNYIFVLDEKAQPNGIYLKEDKSLKNNLLNKENNEEIQEGITILQAFLQDYMDRIINKKLSSTKEMRNN